MQKALVDKFRELWKHPLEDATEGLGSKQSEAKARGEAIDKDDEDESEDEGGGEVGGFDKDDEEL